MATAAPFDLCAYLSEKFPSLSLGGGLLYRWRFGVRFELGIKRFRERAPKLYESVFSASDTCVVVSQDWPRNKLSPTAASRYFPLFLLPRAFDRVRLPAAQRFELTETADDDSVLEWVQLPARSFSYKAIFQGIANHDHASTPSVSSRVYFLNHANDILLHMYDDRGLDVIAATSEHLMRIRREFPDWVLDATTDSKPKGDN